MNKKNLKKELRELFKSMDYIADMYLSKRKISRRKISVFCNIYQQLGLLWEFLGLQCKHWDGYKKKDNKLLCKICGKVRGVEESYYLLPATGVKVIGRMIRPGEAKSKRLSKKEAKIINDTIKFHGAKLNVSVFNEYISKLSKIGQKINIASDRMVTLTENGLTLEISNHIASIKIKTSEKQWPIYGGFLWELPKKLLKRIPIILSYNKKGRLVEIEYLR